MVFPHVARIAPSYGAPEDSPDVAEFLHLEGRRGPLLRNVDLDRSGIWNDQRTLQKKIETTLEVDGDAFLARYGRSATLGDSSLIKESASVWHDRLANRSFQLHSQKVISELLQCLFRYGLAWRPEHSHGDGYVEMHPRLGEAVLAALAFSCARSEGLQLVTEFPQIYARTIHRHQKDIFDSCLNFPRRKASIDELPSVTVSLAELLVYQHCDVSKLTAESLQALNREWEAIGAFRDAIAKLAAEIPRQIENPVILQRRMSEKASDIVERWNRDHKNLSRRVRDLLSGDTEEVAKTVEKLVEKGISESPVGTGFVAGLTGSYFLGGDLTHHALVAAGAGLAISLVVRTVKNVQAAKKGRREDPLRYMTLMQEAGVSYFVSK